MTITARFTNRASAGRELAARLLTDYRDKDAVVLGVPGSGLVVAEPVAEALHAPLDFAFAPPEGGEGLRRHGESRMRDVAASTGRLFSTSGGWFNGPTGTRHNDEMEEHQGTSEHNDRIPAGLSGRTVILVDDGLHSDDVVHATLMALRRAGVAHLCVALPVATQNALDHHDSEVDRAVVLHMWGGLEGMGSVYEDGTVPSAAVIEAMRRPIAHA